MKLRGNFYFLVILLAFMLAVVALSVNMPEIKSKLLPLMIGGTILLLVVIGLRQEISSKRKPQTAEADRDEGADEEKSGFRTQLPMWGWILGFTAGIYLVGFILAVVLFILAFMKLHGTKWTVTVACAAVTAAAIYLIFTVVLRVHLYPGVVSEWISS